MIIWSRITELYLCRDTHRKKVKHKQVKVLHKLNRIKLFFTMFVDCFLRLLPRVCRHSGREIFYNLLLSFSISVLQHESLLPPSFCQPCWVIHMLVFGCPRVYNIITTNRISSSGFLIWIRQVKSWQKVVVKGRQLVSSAQECWWRLKLCSTVIHWSITVRIMCSLQCFTKSVPRFSHHAELLEIKP